MVLIYTSVIVALTVYSWVLIDPNFTLLDSPLWATFREIMVQFGYYQRASSWYCYLALLIYLWSSYFWMVTGKKQVKFWFYIVVIAGASILSYPFLSHDFFNYLFDAKIFTYYHLNPYTHRALDFPSDPWLRFMHWTHRTYPYGPSFLLLSFVPSFISFGKLILHFFLFKALFAAAYIHTAYLLNKMNKSWALVYALNPLVIIEGLINNHNDLIGVWFAVWALYALRSNKKLHVFILGILSGGIKYLSMPILGVFIPNKKYAHIFVASGLIGLITYLSIAHGFQPWYLLNTLVLIPLYPKLVIHLSPFFIGSLLSYYPYIALDGWGNPANVAIKQTIIMTSLILQCIYVIGYYVYNRKKI